MMIGKEAVSDTARMFPGVRGKTSTVSSNQQQCRRTSQETGLTRPGRLVCKNVGNRVCDTRFLHRISGKVTASSGFGRRNQD